MESKFKFDIKGAGLFSKARGAIAPRAFEILRESLKGAGLISKARTF
jgi:hypothetical protein